MISIRRHSLQCFHFRSRRDAMLHLVSEDIFGINLTNCLIIRITHLKMFNVQSKFVYNIEPIHGFCRNHHIYNHPDSR